MVQWHFLGAFLKLHKIMQTVLVNMYEWCVSKMDTVKCQQFVDMSDREQADLLHIIRLGFPNHEQGTEFLMLHFLYSVHAIITYRRFGRIVGVLCLTDMDRDHIDSYVSKGLVVENLELCTNITNVCVHPSLQRRGIGTHLVQTYLNMLPRDSEVFLHVDVIGGDLDKGPHNDLVRWYRRLQFAVQYTNCVETCMYLKK